MTDELKEIVMDKHTQFAAQYPAIKAPRWEDNTFLIPAKVHDHNKFYCTFVGSDGQRVYPYPLYISGKAAREYKTEVVVGKYGERFRMRAVPVSAFRKLMLAERSIHD